MSKMWCVFCLIMLFAFSASAYAEDGDTALAIVQSATNSNAKVDAAGNVILSVFGSIYMALFTAGVCIAVIGMIIAFVEIGLVHAGRLRDMAKGRLMNASIALVLIGGAIAIVNLFLHLIR